MAKKSRSFLLIMGVLILGVFFWQKLTLFTPDDNRSPSLNISPPSNSSEPALEPQAIVVSPEKIEITLTFLGDILCHPTQYQAAHTETGYDFRPSFEDIQSYTSQADLTLANLETTLAGKDMMYSGYPSFNTPEQMALAIKETLGVDVVSTANNHSLDRHYKGLSNTIDFLDQYGISHTGTFKTQKDSEEILLKEIKGVTFAFLSYTYGTNGVTLPPDKPFAVNYIDREKIKRDAGKAKELGTDIIIASIHWGQEYSNIPSAEQKSLAEWVFSNTDVDIISGNHVHTIQPIEFIPVTKKDTQENKEGLVIYAQGNFVSDQQTDSSNMGIVVEVLLDYQVSTEDIAVKQVEYFPTWVDETPDAGLLTYRVLPVERALTDYLEHHDPLLTNADYEEMLAFRSKVKEIIPPGKKVIYKGN